MTTVSRAATTTGAPTTTTSIPDTTATTGAPATTIETAAETTTLPQERFEYAVVAEERSGRLAVLDPGGPCVGQDETCELVPDLTIELPELPHNLAASGSVVYATHPAAGSISRVDVATGEVLTAAVGTEPHDVKYSSRADVLYVADEAGREFLTVDSESLDVINAVALPSRPHDLVIDGDVIWVTLIGLGELARVSGDQVELVTTGGAPHDLIVDRDGRIWFSNWGSHRLDVYDPATGATSEAPAGVSEPHHFAIGPDGTVWVSDNGGSAIVGFAAEDPVSVEVGPAPHHLAFVDDSLVVAVSGSGEAVVVRDTEVVARSQLTEGLHGVAVVTLTGPLR